MVSVKKSKTNKSLSKSISPTTKKSTSRRATARAPTNPYLNPNESDVMKMLKTYLDYKFGIKGWVHIPNEMIFLSWLKKWLPEKVIDNIKKFMFAVGLKPDFPDILIFKGAVVELGPFGVPTERYGMAVEVKREKGGRVRKGQKEYLEYFDSIGWATAIGYGYQDTVEKIEEVYGPYCCGGG